MLFLLASSWRQRRNGDKKGMEASQNEFVCYPIRNHSLVLNLALSMRIIRALQRSQIKDAHLMVGRIMVTAFSASS